ncbi:unnamed protein product [Orchesella dallaii]|uniref:Homeobox domain-containing protein n=1 Tax=Orchesella dallaii TaxID=48710 RepID=A0ABP1RMD4_9HEXA
MLQSTKKVSDFSIAALLEFDTKSEFQRGEVEQSTIYDEFYQQNLKNCETSEESGYNHSQDDCYECKDERKSKGVFKTNIKIKQRKIDESDEKTFSWLNCTRFKPPKLPRAKRKTVLRTQGRGPRIPFTSHQLMCLEKTFESSQYLSSEMISRLARNLQLTDTRVKIWFQNRRARFRREKNLPAPQVQQQTESSSSPSRIHSSQLHFNSSSGVFQCVRGSGNEVPWSESDSEKHNRNNSYQFSTNRQYSRQLINDLNLIAAANLQSSSYVHELSPKIRINSE